MADTSIDGAKLAGVLRLTWMHRSTGPRPRPQPDRRAHRHMDRPGLPDHGLTLGADVDTATLQRLTAHGDIADLIWEAPADLTAEHGQLLLAAIQAYQTGKRETGERLWQQAQGSLVPGVVSELRGTQALSGRRPDPVRRRSSPSAG